MLASLVSQPLWVSLLAMVSIVAYGFLPKTTPSLRAMVYLVWATHGAVALAGLFTGRFGFGPALSVTAWLVLSIYVVESFWYPQLKFHTLSAAIGAVCLALGIIFPGQQIHATASFWLPLHGALGMASYGLLAMAVGHAGLIRYSEERMRSSQQIDFGMPLLTLERLMFRFAAGSWLLLTATLLAGWFFAESLYGFGHIWRWSHKSFFSFLAWLVLTALLLGRWQWGWRGKYAARWIYGSASLLLLAYVGSRFVLEVLLKRT